MFDQRSEIFHCPDKLRAEALLKAALLESLNSLPADQLVMLKITLAEQADFYYFRFDDQHEASYENLRRPRTADRQRHVYRWRWLF